jgi:hypothetical protein
MQPELEFDRPVIIAIGFSRAQSLSRLLRSLNQAEYPHEVDLIISLDGEAATDVIAVAREFEFEHGRHLVRIQPQRLGLRNHILWAGDQSQEHGSVIVLEDDIVVDRHFYRYGVSAVHAYSNESRVAGIALYSPRRNEFANLPFIPLENSLSSYFMQIPCSWGQLWTQSQWSRFRSWYDPFLESGRIEDVDLPDQVKAWSAASWKKYFAAYLVLEDKYFLYPYRSYTTNCSDSGGTHIGAETSIHQVPLADQSRSFEKVLHGDFTESSVTYDAFMEPGVTRIAGMLEVDANSLEVDIYGIKPQSLLSKKKYVLTTKACDEYDWAAYLALRPVEIAIEYASKIRFGDETGESTAPLLCFAPSGKVIANKRQYLRLAEYYSDQEFYKRGFLFSLFLGAGSRLFDAIKRLIRPSP